MTFGVGDWVEVRSKEEILATLDEHGRFEGLPFMPQMTQYCGQRFQVFRRAGKTCSEIHGSSGVTYVSRRLRDTVHLEHRCDGREHGGCQAGCLIFWKDREIRSFRRQPSGRPRRRVRAAVPRIWFILRPLTRHPTAI